PSTRLEAIVATRFGWVQLGEGATPQSSLQDSQARSKPRASDLSERKCRHCAAEGARTKLRRRIRGLRLDPTLAGIYRAADGWLNACSRTVRRSEISTMTTVSGVTPVTIESEVTRHVNVDVAVQGTDRACSAAVRLTKRPNVWTWALLVLVILGAAAIRLRLLDAPLDRDEGEYAYFGQLLLQGIPPYAQAYNFKMPGIYALYALMLAVLGETSAGIHLGLLGATSLTIVLLFLVATRLFEARVALVAAATFASFWFWTVTYASKYGTAMSLAAGKFHLGQALRWILPTSYLVAALAGLGLSALFWDAKARASRRFITLLLGTSLLATSAGL